MRPTSSCRHERSACLNPYELIRKYRCETCGAVMMCACDESFGRRFLSHQLDAGTELETQRSVPVTAGFQPGICSECRGLPAEPAPTAAIPGRTSKIKRYYWRELFFESTRATAGWDESHPDATEAEQRKAHAAIEKQILERIKAEHARAPKYVLSELSQAEVLDRYQVAVESLRAPYASAGAKGAVVLLDGIAVSPEYFVTRHYEAMGWSVLPLESAPIHALFGVMMWLLIQDFADLNQRMAGFGARDAYEGTGEKEMIWTSLPEDFGTSGYAHRRADAIVRHFELLVPERDNLLWLFDLWREPSAHLREYLWAHRPADVDRARRLIEILPRPKIVEILRYLVEDYWGRFVGWPDLLAWRDEGYVLIEVKSSSDKLSEEQKRWIAGNHDELGLPFWLVKIHRAKS